MKVAAIICEYNPFHNGHQYQIQKTRQELGADYVIALMSGNYVQRGEPAIYEKSIRTKLALLGGADLVIELPLWYAASSAQYFAQGSIALLNSLGIVNYLSFGSEENHLLNLKKLCDFYIKNQDKISELIVEFCKDGSSYPAARANAVYALSHNTTYTEIMKKPNNILALEYLIALESSGSSIQPYLVPRTHANYHDSSISKNFASASAIRKQLLSNVPLGDISHTIPKDCFSYLNTIKSPVLSLEDYKEIIYTKLLQEENLCQFFDVSQDISNRFYNCYCPEDSIYDFIHKCQTKSLPQSRISRCLLHIALNMTNAHVDSCSNLQNPLYFQILGFKKSASTLIKEIKEHKTWPMVQHCHDSVDSITPETKELLVMEKQANNIYQMLFASKYHKTIKNQQIIV
ncbi:MAG: nucleotidyltransferase family protein [Anaerostipes sp.]|nr:nucleotidyltransferase family protein [Anaerostipes sp.]